MPPVFAESKGTILARNREQIIPWGVQHIGADKVWPYSRGKGIKVAVLDTGVDFWHPDLKENLKGGLNLLAPNHLPQDDNGHGTHVAGTIAAADNGFGVLGVSPQVHLYALKVLDASGKLDDISYTLQLALEKKPPEASDQNMADKRKERLESGEQNDLENILKPLGNLVQKAIDEKLKTKRRDKQEKDFVPKAIDEKTELPDQQENGPDSP